MRKALIIQKHIYENILETLKLFEGYLGEIEFSKIAPSSKQHHDYFNELRTKLENCKKNNKEELQKFTATFYILDHKDFEKIQENLIFMIQDLNNTNNVLISAPDIAKSYKVFLQNLSDELEEIEKATPYSEKLTQFISQQLEKPLSDTRILESVDS
jgi:hypothetical protein